jgi:predicted MFS family arabinose efflux permease
MTNSRKFYGWKLLIALSSIVSVNLGVTFVGAGVINAPMATDLHLTRGTLGLGTTFFILATGFAAPLVARVIGAVGVRLTLCIGSLLVALGAILLATWVSQGWHFVVVYGLIIGLGSCFGSLIPAQTCATTWFEKRRVLALALVLTGSGLGGSVSAPLMTRVIAMADGNWRAAWYCVVTVALLAGLVSLLFVRNRPSDRGQLPDGGAAVVKLRYGGDTIAGSAFTVHRTREHWTVREAMRTPALWLISLAVIGETASTNAALAHAVPHLRDLGHSAAAAASAMGLFSVCAVAGKLCIGFLCDRLDPRNAWSASILMMGLAIMVATRADSTAAMFLFTGLLGFGSGAALTCWHATVANYFGPPSFASILGAQLPFSNVVSATAPFLVGVVYDVQGSYTPAFYAVAAFAAVSAVLLLYATPPFRSSDQARPSL